MKKQIIKEIFEIDKLLKHEIKGKEKTNKEIQKLLNKINIIEEKIKNINKKNKESKKIINLSYLEQLYLKAIKKNKEKIIIENNLPDFRKRNEQKVIQLEKNTQKLDEKSRKNEEKIAKKKEELANIYEKFKEKNDNMEKEQIIISPDIMSIYLESKTTKEIEFMDKIKLQTKKIKIKNEKLIKQIESYLKNVTNIKSKKESSSNAELSTGVKNSSYFSKKNFFNYNNLNNYNEENENEEIDSTSSISMELETNLNLNELPSDDESLRFIDKVFDIKSNIKPIRNDLKSIIYPPLMPQTKEKFVKVEPIKIEKPIDYKSKNEEIVEKIEIIKKEINDKNSKIEEIKNKKNIIEKKEKMIREALKKSLIKIEIIKEEIACLKKQIDDLLANNKKGQYFRKLSINNIINNRNYCIFENNENNSIYDKETFRK